MSNMSRNHKDNVFCLLYREKKNLLSLYNAMNGTAYEREEDLEVVTLEKAICLKVQNDAAFVIDSFYSGVEKQPEKDVSRLSDMFERKEEDPELELKVTAININPGYNEDLKEKCESLKGYMAFVKKVRDKKDAGMKVEESVRQAVNECVAEEILTEFFTEHRKEIIEMGIFEFDQELHDKALLEDGEAIGMEKGELRKLISMVCKKMGKAQSLEQIAEDLVEEISVIEPIYVVAREFAPDYDINKIFQKMNTEE